MITAIHALVYAGDLVAPRALFRDVLGWPHVDAHDGWLIFKTAPSELGVHPVGLEYTIGTVSRPRECRGLARSGTAFMSGPYGRVRGRSRRHAGSATPWTQRGLAELDEFALHLPVPPGRTVGRDADHELADRGCRGRSSGTPPAGVVPFAADQSPVPGQQRRRGHREHLAPFAAGDRPGKRREPQPAGRLVADPADLAAQHRVLVPEHQEFGIPWTAPGRFWAAWAEQFRLDRVISRRECRRRRCRHGVPVQLASVRNDGQAAQMG